LIAGGIAQMIKILVETIRLGSIDVRMLNSYGGMPSSHTAFVVSLTTVVGIADGITSTTFVIALVVSVITIRDAIGFRMYLSEHARIINQLIAELPAREKPKFPKHIIERIGHTPLQAAAGALVGVISTIILWIVW